jgi:hypothetical protein
VPVEWRQGGGGAGLGSSTSEFSRRHDRRHDGVTLSAINSLISFGFFILIAFPLVNFREYGPDKKELNSFILGGLSVGLLGWLNQGASAVVKHYSLRLILWLSGKTPFNFIKFLDHCAKLIFLKKVGGGYIFVHRMLLDYFAELYRHLRS